MMKEQYFHMTCMALNGSNIHSVNSAFNMICLMQSYSLFQFMFSSVQTYSSYHVTKCYSTCSSAKTHISSSLQGRIQYFSKGVTFVRGGGDYCLITKTCELEACFLYFSYVLAQNGG